MGWVTRHPVNYAKSTRVLADTDINENLIMLFSFDDREKLTIILARRVRMITIFVYPYSLSIMKRYIRRVQHALKVTVLNSPLSDITKTTAIQSAGVQALLFWKTLLLQSWKSTKDLQELEGERSGRSPSRSAFEICQAWKMYNNINKLWSHHFGELFFVNHNKKKWMTFLRVQGLPVS